MFSSSEFDSETLGGVWCAVGGVWHFVCCVDTGWAMETAPSAAHPDPVTVSHDLVTVKPLNPTRSAVCPVCVCRLESEVLPVPP